MRIGVDIRVLMDKYYSGVANYSANLLLSLYKIEEAKKLKGLESNEYSLFYNSWENIEKRLALYQNSFAKIKSLSFPNKVFNYFLQKIFSYPKLDLFLNEPDIFWSPHFNFSSFSKILKTKKIITVHDLSFLRYPEFFSFRKNFWHKALSIKKTLIEADGIIAVSENTKNDIVEILRIDEKKVRVIYSGINLPLATVVAQESEEKSKQNIFSRFNLEKYKDSGYFLYLGTIEPRKNLVNLIKAYNIWRGSQKEKSYPLILAGSKGWKTKTIFSAREKSEFKDDIYFLGYVDDLEKEDLYKFAKIFIYPSFYEGFGFPPLEAMVRGIPVISSNVSSLPEVVSDSALTINPDKPEEIASAIDLILEDEKYRQNLIEKGKERAKLFSWEKSAEEYLNYFQEILESK